MPHRRRFAGARRRLKSAGVGLRGSRPRPAGASGVFAHPGRGESASAQPQRRGVAAPRSRRSHPLPPGLLTFPLPHEGEQYTIPPRPFQHPSSPGSRHSYPRRGASRHLPHSPRALVGTRRLAGTRRAFSPTPRHAHSTETPHQRRSGHCWREGRHTTG